MIVCRCGGIGRCVRFSLCYLIEKSARLRKKIMNYSELKFEQAAFCFMMFYQAKELSDLTMEQFIERVCFESIECCNSCEEDIGSYQKVNATITLICLERTGYILSGRHINVFQKYLELPENRLMFKDEEFSEYCSDLKIAVGYLEWSKEKMAQN